MSRGWATLVPNRPRHLALGPLLVPLLAAAGLTRPVLTMPHLTTLARRALGA